MKRKAIDYKIGGIKCDNPNCDFKDMSVTLEDYPQWLNKPCPKCGSNLLTKTDYNNVKQIVKFANLFNKIIPEKDVSDDDLFKGTINMNGTGKVDIKFDKKL